MADLETSESRWFKIVVFVVSGFFVGFSIANMIYFNRIRKAGGGGGVTQGEATAMLWVNGILLAIAVIIFLWSIYRLIVGPPQRQQVVRYLQEPGTGFVRTETSTFQSRPAQTQVERSVVRQPTTFQQPRPVPQTQQRQVRFNQPIQRPQYQPSRAISSNPQTRPI